MISNSVTSKRRTPAMVILLAVMTTMAVIAWGAPAGEKQGAVMYAPGKHYAVHDQGRVTLTVTNLGQLGTGMSGLSTDCGGQPCPSCEYPTGSNLNYLFGGGFWIGAVVGTDTLVSVGADGWFVIQELMPDTGTAADFLVRSNNPVSPDFSPDAVSNKDLICAYTDTITDPSVTGTDPIDNRPHLPLHAAISQRSYSWANDPVSDFVLFEYRITNVGAAAWQDMFFGIYLDGDVYHSSHRATGFMDDIAGFLPSENIAYIADDDGDPAEPDTVWDNTSVRSAIAVKMHGSKPSWSRVNFNWWISNGNPSQDFGPRLAGSSEDPFRSFGAHLGTPTGDRNKYYILQHAEQDYDQIFTAVSHTSEEFLDPPAPSIAEDIGNGYDTRFLVSVGPYDVAPGDSVVIYFSVVMGPRLHVEPGDFLEYFDYAAPGAYYDRLDFGPLITNSGFADSVYLDNFEISAGADDGTAPPTIPGIASLSPNYPNPFNPSTTISYRLPQRGAAELAVYNLLGERVAVLVDAVQDAGEHVVVWDGCDLAGRPASSGIYFYRLKTEGTSTARKMVLVR
jgi:hypothetical protein